MISITCKSLVT